MKIYTYVCFTLLVSLLTAAGLPGPVCRTAPLPSLIPVSIGETVKFDLQDIFSGFNLVFQGIQKDHIEITPKYTLNQTKFAHSMQFRSAKLKHNGLFLGLIAHDQFTQLAVGYNHPQTGIQINMTIDIEDQHNLHCFDVQQILSPASNKSYAIIDCGQFIQGQLQRNRFLYVDLQSGKLFLGQKQSDVFVQYNHIENRNIQIITDPRTRLEYMFRFILAGDVDLQHADQTYVEIFLIGEHPTDIQIVDVIDYTYLDLPSMAIIDFQIHFNNIYLLVKDRGIYQLALSHRVTHTAFFEVKLNAQKFRVEQNGFNDDLHVVIANQNTIYQYEWDVTVPAVLTKKYALMKGSMVEEIRVDEDFVIVLAKVLVDDKADRRVWVFSRRTVSYTNAFGSFQAPPTGPSIIIYEGGGRVLHLIHQYSSFNIRMNLPALRIFPATQRASDTQDYVIKATSKAPSGQQIQCSETLKLIYIQNTNASIIRTGLQGRTNITVDSPDQSIIMLNYQFFGRNISYDINFDTSNSSIIPQFYNNKQQKAQISLPPQINPSSITYLQMFPVISLTDLDANQTIYGMIQYSNNISNQYPIAYVACPIIVLGFDQQHTLPCRTLSTTVLNHRKFVILSPVYNMHERFIAAVYQNQQTRLYILYYSSQGFTEYCNKTFDSTFVNTMSDADITDKKLVFVTFQYGKRIEVYRLDDLKYQDIAKPIFIINKQVMAFFGIKYFSPVQIHLSVYHPQVAFVRTKSGLLGININQQGFPELLFNIVTPTSQFDFQVSYDSLLIITGTYFEMYRLQTPLRRAKQPFLLQRYDGQFTMNQYSQIDADGFYYLIEGNKKRVLVVHPNMPSTSVIYTDIGFDNVDDIEAVRVQDKEILIVTTGSSVQAYVLSQYPRLHVKWVPGQTNFTMNISAHNQKQTSTDNYTRNYNILQSNYIYIQPTESFNIEQIQKLGHVQVDINNPLVNKNITLNDTQWFTGTITHFNISCTHCHNQSTQTNFTVELQNHLAATKLRVDVDEAVYDLQSTYNGIFGQQYDQFFKTYKHNDSIQHVVKIPVAIRGEVCTKIVLQDQQNFVISLCQTGIQVNAYVTMFVKDQKPVSYGPIRTQAKAVNHAKLVGDILMIVDNADDPFIRPGGVYLYYLNTDTQNVNQMLTVLDYLDYQDLQLQGFNGYPFIASAQLHKPIHNKQQFTVFITQSRTGSLFIFTFQVSTNNQQAIYLTRKMLELPKLIPDSIQYPQPLRIQSVEIIDYTQKDKDGGRIELEYVLLLTVRNWHHIQIQFTIDQEADILFFEVTRLFERVPYPWVLTNYIALRKGNLNASYFAVSYSQFQEDWQIVAIYELPRFNLEQNHRQKYSDGIPITKMLGAYRVRDSSQICFAFNMLQQHMMLFNDVGQTTIRDLQINKELIIKIMNLNPSVQDPQNITITAFNHYTAFNFSIQLTWEDQNKIGTEIVWLVITAIGVCMIIGLMIVWCKQSKKEKKDKRDTVQESLLTVENQFKPNYINRSSVDPESERGTVDFSSRPALLEGKQKAMVKEEASDNQGNEEDSIDEDNPIEERIKQKETSQEEQLADGEYESDKLEPVKN